jgi:hypothetical protein
MAKQEYTRTEVSLQSSPRHPFVSIDYNHFDANAVPRIDDATLLAVQQQIAQQVAFAQTPEVVKRVR